MKENEIIENAKKPLEMILGKLGDWYESLIINLPNIAIAIVVLIISYLLSRLVFNLTIKATNNRIKQKSVQRLVARGLAIVVVLMGLFLALGALNLGKTLTGLLSAAGVSGIVIGLALQGTLSNMISGIVLSFRENIQLGNWIESSGFSGEVTDINLNYFVLKEADNNYVVIPNKTILESPFKNYSLTTQMRITIECGVGYGTDLEKAQRIVLDIISTYFNQKDIGRESEFYYTEFGDSSINFICRFWVDGESSLEKLQAKSKAIIEIKKAFDKENINIPFPIRTLEFNDKLSLKASENNKNSISIN
ncbi:mechanosensitive ion channel family protein [Aquimarina agarilytica]|uniref:mechanosensitive ion channel family protein n=1 Tax=Aquimarina agarilytica TaxID=1087449 RepID=UPI0002899360|nr:mechanosensitive ion channel family protein [Aquimarina agarilytica]